MGERERWEAALRDFPERVNLFGPPAWLVSEKRIGKEEVNITAARIRKDLGIGPVRQLILAERKKGK